MGREHGWRSDKGIWVRNMEADNRDGKGKVEAGRIGDRIPVGRYKNQY